MTSFKVAIAQIRSIPGAIDENTDRICAYIDKARAAGAELVLFPETTVTGYVSQDLFYDRSYIRKNIAALEKISTHTDGITAIVGFIDMDDSRLGRGGKARLYNSAAVLADGEVVTRVEKQLLPSYDIFDERRYFEAGRTKGCVHVRGRKLGIGVCEDLWAKEYESSVYRELMAERADILINLSASPYHYGKIKDRVEQIDYVLQGKSIPLLYSNVVGGYDGYDGEVLFDGRSLVYGANGKLAAVGKLFEEELLVVDVAKPGECNLSLKPQISELHDALVLGMRDYFSRCGFQKAIVGLSGGIDSALVVSLCVNALGKENVIGVTMPSHITSKETKSDAELLAKNLGIEFHERSIKAEYQAWLSEFKKHFEKEPASLTRQNKQARIRGTILMEYSNEIEASLVVATGNKTEVALGYCTLYGDMCGGLALISDLSKEKVYELSHYINSKKELIPKSIIERAPTAELEHGQTDAKSLPADYDVLSPLVEELIDEQADVDALSQKYSPDIVKRVMRLINIYEFKRRQAAPGVRVTKKSFGIGRRVPISHGYKKAQ